MMCGSAQIKNGNMQAVILTETKTFVQKYQI